MAAETPLELVAQGKEVVRNVHTVVVVNSSQLGQFLQVLSIATRKEEENSLRVEIRNIK